MIDIPVIAWVLFFGVIALLAGYAIGHKDGYKQGRQVGYRRGSASVTQ